MSSSWYLSSLFLNHFDTPAGPWGKFEPTRNGSASTERDGDRPLLEFRCRRRPLYARAGIWPTCSSPPPWSSSSAGRRMFSAFSTRTWATSSTAPRPLSTSACFWVSVYTFSDEAAVGWPTISVSVSCRLLLLGHQSGDLLGAQPQLASTIALRAHHPPAVHAELPEVALPDAHSTATTLFHQRGGPGGLQPQVN